MQSENAIKRPENRLSYLAEEFKYDNRVESPHVLDKPKPRVYPYKLAKVAVDEPERR